MAMMQLLPQSQTFDTRGLAGDLNQANEAGFYYVADNLKKVSNQPNDATRWGTLFVVSAAGKQVDYGFQMYCDNNNLYFRPRVDGSWMGWKRITTS